MSAVAALAKAVGAATLALLAAPGTAAAQDNPPDDLTLSAPDVVPGKTIIASGAGCAANTDLTFNLEGRVLATTRTDASGSFRAPLTAPSDASSGTHTILAAGNGCAFTARMTIAPGDTGSSGFLDWIRSGTTVWIALAVVVAATALALGARRRASVRARAAAGHAARS